MKTTFVPGRWRALFLSALCGAMLAGAGLPVHGAPQILSHQGRLLDATGTPLTGAHDITLEVFDDKVAGRIVYGQSRRLVLVDGLYTFNLGEGEAQPDAVKDALAAGNVWLQITVDRVPLTPRERVHSAPYAIWSASVMPGGVDHDALADDSVGSDNIIDGSINEADLEPGLLGERPEQTAYRQLFNQLAPLMEAEPLPLSSLVETACLPDPSRAFRVTINGFTHPQVLAFRASEGISDLMRVEVLFESGLSTISPPGMVNKEAELLYDRNGLQRRFSGIITQAARLGPVGSRFRFAVVIEPHAARLRHFQGFELNQDQDAVQVVNLRLDKALLAEAHSDAAPPAHAVIFQHNETDWDFVSRLLEEEGIWYTFGEESPQPVLRLGNENSHFLPGSSLTYRGPEIERPRGEEYLLTFGHAAAVFPGVYSVRSYQDPSGNVLEGFATISGGIGEVHTLQGPLEGTADARVKTLAGVRADYHRARRMGGISNAGQLKSGRVIQVTDVPTGFASGSFVVTRVVHTGFCMPTLEGTNCYFYANRYELKDTAQPYAPAKVTPVPQPGIQTATVVGAPGESTHVDEHGRIKVRFHWDRSGVTDDSASGWIPVMRPVHGNRQSFWAIPEVDDEVIVGFLEGDPDRPVVLGALPNAQKPPRYALPANKTRMYLYNGSGSNVNEIRMDHLAGSEELFMTSPNFRVSAPNLEIEGDDGLLDFSNDLNVSASGTIAMQSGSTFDLDAGNLLRLSAPQVEVTGSVKLQTQLNSTGTYVAGRAYGDNQLVAWARVKSNGSLDDEHFGISSVSRVSIGNYRIIVDVSFSAVGLIPLAVAEIDAQPTAVEAIRIAAINQVGAKEFNVYINTGKGLPDDQDFLFMVTGR